MTVTSSRCEAHALLSQRLQRMQDRELVERLQGTEAVAGFGTTRLVDIDGVRVFAKSLPVTREEHAHPYRTHNVFFLPAFYHYGVGSAGFGAFRELAVHTKTTRWVLDGDLASFPALYDHRILPFRGETVPLTDGELDEYVAYWDGSEQVRRYMMARRRAEHHLVLFLEYMPHALSAWLPANLGQVDVVVTEVQLALAFLRARGLGHFDAHLRNILTDGARVFLTDFGLAMDAELELDAEERAFLTAHRHYDDGAFILSLYRPATQLVDAWSEDTQRAVRALGRHATPHAPRPPGRARGRRCPPDPARVPWHPAPLPRGLGGHAPRVRRAANRLEAARWLRR